MRSTGKLVATIVLLSAIGLGAWYWLAQPKAPPAAEVAEKWSRVLGWTQIDGALGRPVIAGLDETTRTPHIPALTQRHGPDEVPVVNADDVPADYLAQVDAVLAWGARPRFEGTCADEGVGPLVMHERLRAALAMAGPDDVDRAQAVLKVASALRHRGSMLLTFIGLEATLGVARWAKARGVPIWPELRAAQPTPAGFVRAVVREAVCSDALIARAMADGDDLPAAMRQLWRVRAHDSVAPLQMADPTFAALANRLKSTPKATGIEGKLVEVIELNRTSMLEKFEKAATDFAALVGE